MNHSEMVKEGNRLNAILDIQTGIVQDKAALKEQVALVMDTSKAHKERLSLLADAIHADCSCGHSKKDHQLGGRGPCLSRDGEGLACSCKEWAVDTL